MGNNLIQVLLASIKAKITPLVTKFRQFTSTGFLRAKLIAKIREFFIKLFDVRPKNKNDYYEVFGWLVSKKLAYAILIVIGVLSMIYLVSIRSMYLPGKQTDGIKTYDYNDVMLRFAKGTVRIRGKSGYIAYQGDVEKGGVTGFGNLYGVDGTLLYQGNFADNEYEGNGIQYYPDGTMHYRGSFSGNLYEGTGKLYRENGSLAYDGEFARGMKEGVGKLYGAGDKPVYEGSFSQDQLVYSALLGKSTAEVADAYNGGRIIYQSDNEFTVLMPDINALYVGATDEDNLEDQVMVNSIYVLKNTITFGKNEYSTIAELRKVFGEEVYDGNSIVTLPEAVAINYLNKQKQTLNGSVEMDMTEAFTDVFTVDGIQDDYPVYLYSFRKGGLLYTFVCGDRNDRFAFYSIMSGEGGE